MINAAARGRYLAPAMDMTEARPACATYGIVHLMQATSLETSRGATDIYLHLWDVLTMSGMHWVVHHGRTLNASVRRPILVHTIARR